MSNSLLEAMATSLPCAVSGIGGNTDLIVDQQTGRIVSTPTPDAWATVIVEMLQAPERTGQLGVEGRRFVDKHLSLGVVVDRYAELYRNMIAGHWPPRGHRD
jgi:glycosyltransferase involved in cell wall biosynthesis